VRRASTRARRAAAISGVLALAATGVVALGTAAHAASTPLNSVIVDGRGYGHGVGLSQWGAYGNAVDRNMTWHQILGLYYGGTTLSSLQGSDFPSRLAPGTMSVRLITLDDAATAVVQAQGQASTPIDPQARAFGTLVAREIAGRTNVYRVYGRAAAACPAPGENLDDAARWTLVADNVTGPVTLAAPGGDDPATPVANLLAVCEPSGAQRSYRGAIQAANGTAGENRTVNVVPIESYLRGVVPRESPALWGDAGGGKGMNALRAQAVAARSYAMSEGQTNSWGQRYSYAKTCDTQACQVYGGAGLRVAGGSLQLLEDPRTDQAVAETAGKVMRTAAGPIAYTMFSSSNGGRTTGTLFPNVDDPGDATASNPHHTWSVLLTAAKIEAAYPSIGHLTSASVTARSGGGTWGGRATSVRLSGTSGSVTLTGDQLRLKFDLKSNWFQLTGIQVAPAGAPTIGQGLFIGDSVGASVSTGFEPELPAVLDRAYPNLTLDAVSSRCTTGSCSVSPTGVQIVNALTTVPDYAVVELGYNDSGSTFGSEIDAMMQALTAKGVRVVFWVNLSTRRTSGGASVYAPHNAALVSAMGRWKNMAVLDWNTASTGSVADRWFISGDWVHLTGSGQAQFAYFLRQQLDNARAFGLLTPPPPPPPPPTSSSTVTPTGPPSPTTSALPVGPFRVGSRGTGVVEVQRFLTAYGYAPGPVDGSYGNMTASAVKRFQTEAKAKGWYASVIDGIWGLRSRDAAYRKQQEAAGAPPVTTTPPVSPPPGTTAPASLPAGPFQVGSRGTGVSTVQRFLSSYGYVPGPIDGIYGTQTAGAVKRFQTEAKAKGWYAYAVDGIWGTRTRDAALRKIAGG